MDLTTSTTILEETASVEEGWWTYLTDPSYTLVAGMLCGLAVNFVFRFMPREVRSISMPSFSSFTGNSKMVLVVRTDLGMQKGKAAAQCAHAALACYKKALKSHPDALASWERTGQAKVCLKTDSEESLLELAGKARETGITWSIVRDAGRTQVPQTINILDLNSFN
ncbi:peptidyl-tRNA hydrolase 2, mitochondrial isoform X2 [Eurytemora carolleeae]|uniref:peptidyl-tRNA hydrolase 2, mitochondrial isoform X2 n=1 Tax=Eurytemora carolleeae TaxID=1294199 RepID=UPI000C7939FD|nr:peptidyl-tRNA hydrolase 2, mitochondrial isoform X2 [Eurytemora carolleeae]|eukprot:XP_023320531.1 peptidyl-tRNA hydrolase 2, mitochondrial-like isoform X2 [Eurytemora affinis]